MHSSMRMAFSNLGSFGALGNQLWQIAGAYGEGMKRNIEPTFPKWYYQDYFSVPERFFDYEDVIPGHRQDMGQVYLQDVDHWWKFRSDVFRMFEPSDLAYEMIEASFDGIELSQYTAVHVRRANNLHLPNHHPVPSLEYFEEALDYLVNNKDVIVFSDDLDWCRKQSVFDGAIFGVGNPGVDNVMELTAAQSKPVTSAAIDLLAMAQCRDMVISNSTFSGWAALISSYKNFYQNTVISPRKWYGK